MTTTKKKVFPLSAAVCAVGVFVCLLLNRTAFFTNDALDIPLYLASWGMGLAASVLFAVRMPKKESESSRFGFFLAASSAPFIFIMMELVAQNNAKELEAAAIVINFILIWLFLWALLCLTRRFSLSVQLVAVVCFLLAVANDAVVRFRGQPISALDLYSLKTALTVSRRYQYPFEGNFWSGLMMLLLVFSIAQLAKGAIKAKRLYSINLIACILCEMVFFFGFYKTDMLKKLDISDYLWNQKLSFADNGQLLSLLYSTRYLMIDTPDGYSPQRAQELLQQAANIPQDDLRPNIIAVMNESFADLELVGELTASEDPLAFYHSLEGSKNTITGDLLVSAYGGSTCNTEFEFLTGCSLSAFPTGSVVYQQYITEPLPNLTTTLADQGYTTVAVHPFYGYCWKRDDIYPLLGFDHFLDISAFPDARTMGGYMGNSVCDESNYEKLFEIFENKEEDERLFIFNVTMQNHGGYSQILGCEEDVRLFDFSRGYRDAENYLSLLRESDKQLKNLLDYFSRVDEPTLIVFFGDHQPNLSAAFYDELYGVAPADRTLAQVQNQYKTPFLIWANYDIGQAELGCVSANYLSSLTLQAARLKMPDFNEYLLGLYKKIPAVNANGYQTAGGSMHSFDDELAISALLEEYRILQHNLMFDTDERVTSGFTVS